MKKIILIIICFLLTGCYDYKEINDLGIISSILIDYDNEYKVTLELVNDEEIETISCNGYSLDTTLNKCDISTDKELNYSHLNTLFVTKSVDINELFYYFLRKNNINNNFFISTVDNTDIFNNKDNIGLKVFNILNEHKYKDFFSLSRDYINDTFDISIPFYDGNIESVSMYKDNKYTTNLVMNDFNMLNLLINNDSITFDSKCDDNILSLKINKINIDYKIKDGIKINLDIFAGITNTTCNVDTSNKNDIKYLENISSNELKSEINNLIKNLKKNKIDSLGINKLINNKYKSLNNNYIDYKVEVNPTIHIYKKGLLLK